jgi:hypothetical protein
MQERRLRRASALMAASTSIGFKSPKPSLAANLAPAAFAD